MLLENHFVSFFMLQIIIHMSCYLWLGKERKKWNELQIQYRIKSPHFWYCDFSHVCLRFKKTRNKGDLKLCFLNQESDDGTMGYSRKKNKQRGLRIWNFQEYQRNSMWNFQRLIKNKVEFPRVTNKKCGISRTGVLVLGLGISKVLCNTILWNFLLWKKYVLTPASLAFFLVAQCHILSVKSSGSVVTVSLSVRQVQWDYKI